MLRMRNLWLVLVVLTGLSTVGKVTPPWPMAPATLDMMRETGGSGLAETGRQLGNQWGDPLYAVTHVSSDLRTGLDAPLYYGGWVSGRLYHSAYTGQAPGPEWWVPRLLAVSLPLFMLGALFTVGVYWWVLAAVRGEEQTAQRFWETARRSFWPLVAWTGVLNLLWRGAYQLIFRIPIGTLPSEAASAALAVLVLPLLFTSKVIVVVRPPLYRAPVLSARMFASYLPVVVGFAIPFIIVHDLVWAVDGALTFHYYGVWEPLYPHRFAMPALAFAVQMARVAVELTITTAFIILVSRWQEAERPEPEEPEAAPA
jgi:hypothetical protein